MISVEDDNRAKRTARWILLSVCIGQIIVGLDLRAITVALPTLTTSFRSEFTTIQWTILVYDLVLIGLIITMGRLGDLFGRRRFYSLGFLIFVAGSALCGLAQSTGQLIFFRAVQAIGGSMIAANGRAIVSVNLPQAERGRALGLTSTAFHIGFLTGPSLGGFLIDTIGWRWIFYINMPFSIWGAYLAWKVVPETRAREKFAVDLPGAFLLLLTNGLFIYAIDQLPRVGWRHPVFLSTLAFSLVSLIFLLRIETRAKTPILTLSMFHDRLFSAGISSLFLVAGTLSAINFLLPFYLQYLLGYSPSQVGWIIVADSLVIMIMAPIAGALSDRLGSRLLCTIGCAIVALAQFFLASLDIHASLLRIMVPLVIWGVGWALFNAPNQSSILGAVSPEKIGAGAGMIATTARAGGAMGVALSATLFGHLVAAAGFSSTQIGDPENWRAAPETFMDAFSTTIYVLNFFTALAIIFSAVRGQRRTG
ncbi:MAG TPA: MFS transporter [Candidatus Binatia bacterium]|jgi:EmrB/QacA subfamily drug resistance transporter